MSFNTVELAMVGGNKGNVKAFGSRNTDGVGEGNLLVDRFKAGGFIKFRPGNGVNDFYWGSKSPGKEYVEFSLSSRWSRS
jgi:hypothetical protein